MKARHKIKKTDIELDLDEEKIDRLESIQERNQKVFPEIMNKSSSGEVRPNPKKTISRVNLRRELNQTPQQMYISDQQLELVRGRDPDYSDHREGY